MNEFKKAESAEDCLKILKIDQNNVCTNMAHIIEKQLD